MQNKYTLGVIGAGNMAYAIVGGIINGGILKPSDIAISDIDAQKLKAFAKLGVYTQTDNVSLSANCENLLFAVKPQIAQTVFKEIESSITANTVISIMAGITLSKLKAALGNRNYARIMPNTPALVGKGMSAIAFSENFYSDFVMNIFRSVGEAIQLDESRFDAVTSLSGSGPAYVYTFIKALIDGGMSGGLDFETSEQLALQTVLGAVEMIKASDKPINELIDAVCSKGGTTIQAIDSFREDGLENIIKNGMNKCLNRSVELSKE